MPIGPTVDSNLLTIYKEWYSEDQIANLLFRMSPMVDYIPKIRVGGKTYNFAAQWGVGGAQSGDYTVAVANAANGQAKNSQFAVPPQRFFSVFNISQQEVLASQSDRGAFVKMAVDKMFAGMYAFRQALAASFYGSGFGEIGHPTGGITSTGTTLTLSDDCIVKMNVGTTFDVTTSTAPGGGLNEDGPFTVTKIDGNTITFTRSGTGHTGLSTYWIVYHGGSDGSGVPYYPQGLAAWVPSIYGRSGSSWSTYIGTTFMGVNRSLAVQKLAGNYYDGSSLSAPTYSSAISQGERIARKAGGRPEIVALNDNDYWTIQKELQSYRNFWQSVDIQNPAGGPTYTFGLEALKFAFSTNYIEYVYDDPFCPQGLAYILECKPEKNNRGGGIEFAGLSNVERPTETKVKGNNPGADPIEGTMDPTNNPYKFLLDDYLEVRPGSDAASGPAARVSLALYGNWAFHQPAHQCVVKLA